MKKLFFLLGVCLLSGSALIAQDKQYQVACIAFYNFENLFDTIDTENVRDSEFTPEGDKKYNSKIYNEKLENLSKVVSQLGTEMTPDGPALLGVAEIENRSVLEDFVKHKNVAKHNYQIAHHDSPDKRGIDVGLLYNPKYFTVKNSSKINPELRKDNGDTIFTRDILWVEGEFQGEEMHVFVNHWPSRRGGERRSSPLREKAAAACKKVVDEITAKNPKAKIVIMGDLNDDPTNASVKNVLMAKGKKQQVKEGQLYNPMWSYYKKGIGTLGYNDAWNLFDQIILSHGLLDEEQKGFRYYKTIIYNKPFLIQKEGRFKGYPWRTYSFGDYVGGYSDHLPVYVFLVKEIEK